MSRPKLTVGGLMVVIATIAFVTWAAILATTPVRPRSWVYAKVLFKDYPVRSPAGNSWEPADQQEEHVRRAVSDELLLAATPGLEPERIRRRVRVVADAPDVLWYQIETDSPEEREMVGRMASAYVRSNHAIIAHPPTPLAPLTYPNVRPVALVSASIATLALLCGGTWLVAKRRAVSPSL